MLSFIKSFLRNTPPRGLTRGPGRPSAFLCSATTKFALLGSLSFLFIPGRLQGETDVKDHKDRLSYSIGIEAGKLVKQQMIDVDLAQLRVGIADGLRGTPRMSESQLHDTLTALQTSVAEKRAAARKAEGEKNVVEGPRFLAENKTKEGVMTTPSGLQYKVLRAGSGPSPTDSDRVVINFVGMKIGGEEFENSQKSGHAETVPVNRMIKGWREGLKLMNAGAKFRLFVPPDLAFGKVGAGVIAPNATLIFDMELLGIVPPKGPAPVGAGPSPADAVSPSKQ